MHLERAASPLLAHIALDRLSQSACLIVAVDQDDNFLSVCDSADTYGQSVSRNLLRIIVKESGVDNACVRCQCAKAGAGCKGCERLVESEMSVNTDTAHEEVDAAVGSDFSFVARALCFRVLSEAVKNVDVLRLHIYKMIEEIIVHEIPVALVMLARETYIFVHVECDDICKTHFAGLIHADKLLINADRRRSGRKTENERSVFLVVIDLLSDIVRCPLAHLIVIFLNNYSHLIPPYDPSRGSRQ